MSNFVFNAAKGKAAYYASQAGTGNAAIIVIPVGGTDSITAADATLATVLTHCTEQTTMGRKTITSVTMGGTSTVTADTADITWTAASGSAIVALIFAYDADTTGGTDSNIIPLTHHDFAATPDGNNITATVSNFYSAT